MKRTHTRALCGLLVPRLWERCADTGEAAEGIYKDDVRTGKVITMRSDREGWVCSFGC